MSSIIGIIRNAKLKRLNNEDGYVYRLLKFSVKRYEGEYVIFNYKNWDVISYNIKENYLLVDKEHAIDSLYPDNKDNFDPYFLEEVFIKYMDILYNIKLERIFTYDRIIE